MKRETRNKKRTDQNRVATSDSARVLRRRPSIRLFLVVILASAVVFLVPSVGCNSWRSIGRVDSSRGEFLLNDKDSSDLWRASASDESSNDLSIRGQEVGTYEVAPYVDDGAKKTTTFADRFKHMFRKPQRSASVTEGYSSPIPNNYSTPASVRLSSSERSNFADSSRYVKGDASPSETRASLSGMPNSFDASKESFWAKFFRPSRNDRVESEPEPSVERRAGGLAREDGSNDELRRLDRSSYGELQPSGQIYVRKRWTTRDANDATESGAVANRQNAVANRQNDAVDARVANSRNELGALLIRCYDMRRFLPPFDVVEQYYYPSGIVETFSEDETTSAFHSVGPYRSRSYSPVVDATTDASIAQTSPYSSPTARSVYAAPNVARMPKTDADESESQVSDSLERRGEFSWFDFAPGSLTPSEQSPDANLAVNFEESKSLAPSEAPERYEGKTNGYRSADEILDESARRQKNAGAFNAPKSVSYETPANEKDSSLNASSIGNDVFGESSAPSVLDVSAFLGRQDEINGAVVALNSVNERKSENASAPLKREEIEWIKRVKEAIQSLLNERAELKKRGENTSLCDARLRLLYLVVGEYDRQIQTIEDADDPLKVFWQKECDGLETLLHNKLEEIDPVFVAETLRSGLDSFFEICDVQIRKALLVDAPACFGLYEARVKTYRPGEVVYAYAELDYVVDKETPRGHEIAVECRWRLLDSNGNALTEFQTQRCENVAETRLRDVVLNVSVPLSDAIVPNDYLLELEIVDLNARESAAATKRLVVKVAADSVPNARG